MSAQVVAGIGALARGARLGRCRPPAPDRPPGVSRYRVFMTVVFCGVVLMDVWADRGLSSHLRSNVVGPASVIVWVLTLFGAFGVGPAGWLRSAMRW